MYKTVITEDPAQYTSVRPKYRELAALVASDTRMHPTDSNTLSLLPDARQKFDVMLEDLRGASESVYIELYRFRLDSIGTTITGILKQKASQGADVRTIVDLGANVKQDRLALLSLNDCGIASHMYYRPMWINDRLLPSTGVHRDHRKIVLIDGKVGYMGGRNIQDKYLDWRDCDIRIAGPAVMDLGKIVAQTQRQMAPQLPELNITARSVRSSVADTVAGMHQFKGKTVQIIPDTPWDKALPVRNCLEWAIANSKRYFYFYNPYSPPPESTLKELKKAAARGVDVRWIIPGNNDVATAKWIGESLYMDLLLAGVKIYEWQGNVLHAKEFISDDYLTIIGSANMDNLSFFLNLEVDALVFDEEVAIQARDLFLEDTGKRCHRITLDEVRRWNFFRKARNWFTRFAIGGVS